MIRCKFGIFFDPEEMKLKLNVKLKKKEDLTMTLARFKNRDMFPSLFNEFLNRDMFDLGNTSFNDSTLPAVNIKETKDDFLVEVAAPGMNKDDFKIEIDNGLLVISTEKEEKSEDMKDGEFTRREFSYQSFRRSFTLPKTIHDDKVKANYKDGVLMITLPKKEEAKEKPKRMIKIG
jgi:HSP20 family protein